ncbi:MAG: hypothetical protein L6W00_06275 [Lentisphaeria bacterium]|nr:MAG: hypothetical protein L6W00_06275 [Lentisphaeria bacterium]
MATDGVECVAVSVKCEVAEAVDFAVEYRALRELIRSTRGGEVEVTGTPLEWPELEVVPEEAVSVELPASFGELLALAAPVTDRDGARLILRGVNLSPDGITATNGKELLHLPLSARDSGGGYATVSACVVDGETRRSRRAPPLESAQ